MYKTFVFLLCSVLIWSCGSGENSNKKIDVAVLQLDKFSPKTAFDNCLTLETYQLLAADNTHLEEFITAELLSEGEDLAVGYQRFVEEWTGQRYSQMDTEKLLNNDLFVTRRPLI